MVVLYEPKKGDINMGHHRRRCRPRCRPNCGCQGSVNKIVHPVRENVVNCCTEETVQHIHPSHTTIRNHHLIRNEHFHPHTTSTENFVNEIDVQGDAGNQVGGAMNPGGGNQGNQGNQGHHGHHGGHGHHGHHHCQKHSGCRCKSCRRRRRRF